MVKEAIRHFLISQRECIRHFTDAVIDRYYSIEKLRFYKRNDIAVSVCNVKFFAVRHIA